MERGQPAASFGWGEVNGLIGSGRDNVEFWIEHIDTVHNTVESRKGEGCVRLILSNSVLAVNDSRDLVSRSVRKLGERTKQQTHLPAISWNVLVIMKSVWFMAKRSAVNWQEKWYLSSSFFQ